MLTLLLERKKLQLNEVSLLIFFYSVNTFHGCPLPSPCIPPLDAGETGENKIGKMATHMEYESDKGEKKWE